MKQCPKCKKELSEETLFCPVCGEKTVDASEENAVIPVKESVRYCTKCGTPNNGDAAFCPKCGTPFNAAEKSGALVTAEQEQIPDEEHTWRFAYDTFGNGAFDSLGTKETVITAHGTMLSVSQHSRFLLIPYSRHSDQFDVRDINAIVQETKISIWAIIEIILGLAAALPTSGAGLLLVALGIWTLKDHAMLIQHSRGGIRIMQSKRYEDDRNDFLNYVHRYNPNCIRMFVA